MIYIKMIPIRLLRLHRYFTISLNYILIVILLIYNDSDNDH